MIWRVWMHKLVATAVIITLTGCSLEKPISNEQATLYRNSHVMNDLRVHWATFDASDGGDYNLGNCQMAARLLNANVRASAAAEGKEPYSAVGFWCEVGAYSEDGGVPVSFDAEFPTDTRSPMRFTN